MGRELLAGGFEHVIFDSPPLLAVSDPAVMAPRVDGVVLAIRVEKNGRPEVLRAREMLTSVGADVPRIRSASRAVYVTETSGSRESDRKMFLNSTMPVT